MYYDENDPEEIACRNARFAIRDELLKNGFSQKGRLYEFSHSTITAFQTEQLFRDLLLMYSKNLAYEIDIQSWEIEFNSRYLGLRIKVNNSKNLSETFHRTKANEAPFFKER